MFRVFYALFGIIVLAGFSYLTWFGIQPGMGKRQYVAGGLRGAAHGGYRSFWYSGFHGGK